MGVGVAAPVDPAGTAVSVVAVVGEDVPDMDAREAIRRTDLI